MESPAEAKWTSAEVTSTNDPELLTAIREALATTTTETSRYAPSRIQLGGPDGTVTGTNGHELYSHSGFAFPFNDPVLMPGNKIFGCTDLTSDAPIKVSRNAAWLTFDFGYWRVRLALDQDKRFPKVSVVIPDRTVPSSELKLSDGDVDFLSRNIRTLPAANEANSPITVDLNGQVCLRAKAEFGDQITEAVLTTSYRSGGVCRFNSNRKLIGRAINLGFCTIRFIDADRPLVCQDDRRTYLWMTLNGSSPLESGKNPIRIMSDGLAPLPPPDPSDESTSPSPVSSSFETTQSPQQRNETNMTTTNPNSNTNHPHSSSRHQAAASTAPNVGIWQRLKCWRRFARWHCRC